MLIAEVNEFDKKQQIEHLDALFIQGIMPEMPDSVDLKNSLALLEMRVNLNIRHR